MKEWTDEDTKLIGQVTAKFSSGNSIPVERAIVTKAEFDALMKFFSNQRDRIDALVQENFDLRNKSTAVPEGGVG